MHSCILMRLNALHCQAMTLRMHVGYIVGYRVMLGDMQWVALGDGRLHKFDDAAIIRI